MAQSGLCRRCGKYVRLADDGTCPQGHAADQISDVHDVGIPASSLAARIKWRRRPELIAAVALVVVGVLALCYVAMMLAFPLLESTRTGAGEARCLANQRTVLAAARAYEADHAHPPSTLQDLVDDKLLPSIPVCPSGGTYTWDPQMRQIRCSIHGTAGTGASPGATPGSNAEEPRP